MGLAHPAVLIVPPHRDPTLEIEAPAPFRVVDLQRPYWKRQTSPALIADRLRVLREAKSGPESFASLLRLSAAAAVRERNAGVQASLRADGLIARELTADQSVRVSLDDVELSSGTTERTADLIAATAGKTPFDDELQLAVAECEQAERIAVLADCDQRLPFLFALAARLPGRALELVGQFARLHLAGLRSALGDRVSALELNVRQRVGDAEWVWEGQRPVAGPYSGYLELGARVEPAAGLRVGVLPFAAIADDRVLSVRGEWIPLERLAVASNGVCFVGEWWFGAPGVDEALHQKTAAALEAKPAFFDWLGGLRRFHLHRSAESRGYFAGQELVTEPRENDLWRSHRVLAPASLPDEMLHPLVHAILEKLQRSSAPPAPGRVAAALLAGPDEVRGGKGAFVLAPDVAVVDAPFGPSGKAEPVTALLSLGSGSSVALSGKLSAALHAFERKVPASAALSVVPGGQREKLLSSLVARGMLFEVEA